MSIIAKFKNLNVPEQRERHVAERADLEAKRTAAQGKLNGLNSQLSDAALAWATEETAETKKAYDTISTNIRTVTEEIRRLDLAVTEFDKRVAAFEQEVAAKAKTGRILSGQRFLTKRNESAAAFSAAAEKMIAAYKELIANSGFAKANLNALPDSAITTKAQIDRLVANELYRLSGVCGLITGRSLNPNQEAFIGSRQLDLLTPDPAAIKPLTTTMETAAEQAISAVKAMP